MKITNTLYMVVLLSLLNCEIILSENIMIDNEKLLEQRKKTTISGVYIKVWNTVFKELEKNTNLKLEEYVINIDENDKEFIVKFSKPFIEPVAGGGVGKCTLDKGNQEIKCQLIR